MANVWAVKSGSWSDTTVWNTGALPTSGDDVFANNFVVNVDTSPTVLTVRTASGTGIAAGGRFELQNGVTLTCTASTGVLQGTTSAVVFSLASPNTATLNAGLTAGRSGASTGASQVLLSGTGTLNTSGTIAYLSSGATASNAITVSGTGATLNHVGNVNSSYGTSNQSLGISITGTSSIVNITGDIIHRCDTSGSPSSAPVLHTVNCTINVTGNIYFASGLVWSGGYRSAITSSSGTATVTVTGGVTGSDYSGPTATLSITGTLTVIGTATGGQATPAISQSNLFVTGPLVSSNVGIHPIYSTNWRWYSSLSPTYYSIRNSANTAYRNLYTSDNASSGAGQPATTNVRSGTVYGPSNELTGTCAVPAAGSVALGVAVDNTTGTAILTQQNVQDALTAASAVTLNQQTSSLTTAGSIGERLKLASTVATTAQQLSDALSNE